MASVHLVSLAGAARSFFRDVPATLAALAFSAVVTIVAIIEGREPGGEESVRLFLAAAGLLFHLSTRKEIASDRDALMSALRVDPADIEAIDNMLRKEYIRIAVKATFIIATLSAMAIPPQDTAPLEIARMVGSYSLLVILALLDTDAVLDRASRRRQIELIRETRETRRVERIERERALRPVILARNEALSVQGRELAHGVNNDLAKVVAVVEMLRAGDPNDQEREDLEAADAWLLEAAEKMKAIQTLVRGLAETEGS